MKTLLVLIFGLLLSNGVMMAQAKSKIETKKAKTHKIIFQMVSKDTADHSALVRQILNIQQLAPGTKIEVVCHGPGLSFIQKGKSLVLDKLAELAAAKVDFVGCEFTMTQKNIARDQLMDQCRTVPGGILEIVERLEKNWNYIKAGY